MRLLKAFATPLPRSRIPPLLGHGLQSDSLCRLQGGGSQALHVRTAGMEGSEAAAAVHPSGIIPTLQNIVATVNLGCKLELKKIAMGARNAEYNPKRFAAVIMRIREPKTTALIFASGKMVRLYTDIACWKLYGAQMPW